MSGALAAWRDATETFDFRGHAVAYRREGTGPTLLLVHGYPFGSIEWQPMWDTLVERFDVIAADMLGMGFSEKPLRASYTLQGHADMYEALLRHLDVDECATLGHDLGVSVVQELLARRMDEPDLPRITDVVFLNGGLFPEGYRPRPIQRILSSPAGHLVGPLLPRSAIRRTVRSMFGPDTEPSETELDLLLDVQRTNGGRFVAHRVGRFVQERMSMRDRLVAPLLDPERRMIFINGMADPNSGSDMVELIRTSVPSPEIVALEGIGHWPHLEAPEVVGETVVYFLTRRR